MAYKTSYHKSSAKLNPEDHSQLTFCQPVVAGWKQQVIYYTKEKNMSSRLQNENKYKELQATST